MGFIHFGVNDTGISVQFGTVSGNDGMGTGDWLHYSNDYVSGQLELDSNYDTGQVLLAPNRLLDVVISRDALEPTPEPHATSLLLIGWGFFIKRKQIVSFLRAHTSCGR